MYGHPDTRRDATALHLVWPQTISAITHSARVLLYLDGILKAVDDGRASVTLRSDESVERGLHIQKMCVGGVPNLIPIRLSLLAVLAYCSAAFFKPGACLSVGVVALTVDMAIVTLVTGCVGRTTHRCCGATLFST